MGYKGYLHAGEPHLLGSRIDDEPEVELLGVAGVVSMAEYSLAYFGPYLHKSSAFGYWIVRIPGECVAEVPSWMTTGFDWVICSQKGSRCGCLHVGRLHAISSC